MSVRPADHPDTCLSFGASALRLVVALFLSSSIAADAAPPPTEYQVEAALLLNFAEFIQWPANTFPNPKSPLVVGLIGDDPFGSVLDNTFAGSKIDGHPIVVRRVRLIDDLKTCQMVFISRSEKDRLGEILSSLDTLPIVTVSEIDGFCWRGGIINFYISDNRVRFEVNLAVARKVHLKLRAELLSRAKIIGAEASGR